MSTFMANLTIVSNRLPVSIKRENGKLVAFPSTGGLATGLSGYTKRTGTKWIGWPGLPSDGLTDADQAEITRLLKKYRCYPVFLTKRQIDEFYNCYSNGVLWPLFHDLQASNKPTDHLWKAYYSTNQQFTDEVVRLSEPDATIWVHDYQMMLVPGMLRAERPTYKIGFFLHIPFPDPNKLLALPHAQSLLAGLFGADLVGFHTSSYTENFLSACRQVGLDSQDGGMIDVGARVLQATEFPMGIDYARFEKATHLKAKLAAAKRLRGKYQGQKVILTVDRLDPSKGLVERLQAYQLLLRENPELRSFVVMVMIVSPSRTEVKEYIKLKNKLDVLVDEITDEFSTVSWKPVDYIYETVPLERVMEYYLIADVAFIAPLRDGMNLVAKEFIASKTQKSGVLVLSKTAGAAEELKEAIQVNPHKPRTVVRGLQRALNLPASELRTRTQHMKLHLKKFTVQNWADTFMDSLQKPRTVKASRIKSLTGAWRLLMLRDYNKAEKRLLIFDYDGTLRQFVNRPEDAAPSKRLLLNLKRLSSIPENEVVIISGRDRQTLQGWLGNLPIALAAEHGAYFRRKGGKNWHKTYTSDMDWKPQVRRILEQYVVKTPGSLFEQKDWALVWHYRNANPYTAQKNLVHLRRLLKPIANKYNLLVKDGEKIIEINPADISKAKIAREWLIHDHDFVLCIGDDTTDEDMFDAMPAQAYSVKVGRGLTHARFRMSSVDKVLELLSKL